MMKKPNSQLALVCVMTFLLGLANTALGVDWPPNDDCSEAEPIGEVANLAFNTTNARFDGRAYCMVSPNVWYCYTPTCTGDVTVTLSGANFDTMLAVYNGCSCFPEDLVECNDDSGEGHHSQITFAAVAGNQYMIEVGGYGLETGQGFLTVSCGGAPPPPPPSKDDCANAQAVGDVTDLAFDTSDATFDGPGHCMSSPNIWYCYTASCTGDVTVSLLGSGYDTMLAVYKGCECYPTSGDLIGCNDDAGAGQQSEITFAATVGSQYLIEIGGYGSETGQGVLTITCGGQLPPSPPGDNCADALSVGDVTDLSFDTSEATFDGPGRCMSSPNIWYCYTASCTGNVTVGLSGSNFDTMLAVYDGCGCYPTSNDMIGCDDDSGPGYQSRITFAALAGNEYLIEIGGYGSETGHGRLSINCEPVATPQKPDLGDAPDSSNNFGNTMTAYPKGAFTGQRAYYPTVFDDGRSVGPYGPAHVNAQIVAYLGKKITSETEADIGYDEDGINNIKPSGNQPDNDGGDDGVVLPLNLPHCRWTTFDYTVKVVKPGTDLWVNIWCDWNRDGDWDDTLECTRGPAPEWAVQNQFLFDLPEGLNQITTPAILPWHPADGPKEMWVRITLSEQPWKGGSNPGVRGNGGSGPRAKYRIGETEDYYFTPDLSYTVCEDYNGDGVINSQDLVDFTAAWLENCPE